MSEDKRFAKFGTDPKFRSVPKKEKKLKIDSRFESVFTDKRFNENSRKLDKRGKRTLSSKQNLQKFYRQSDDSSSDDGDDAEAKDDPDAKSKKKSVAKVPTGIDYARGEGVLESSSSEEDSSSEEEEEAAVADDGKDTEHFDKWGELDHDAQVTDEATSRLAVCNLDWDRVGAQDIFLALNSFCPKNESVSSIQIYISEFGKTRLKDEERLGPEELRGDGKDPDSEDEDRIISGDLVVDQEEIERQAMERVRLYQVRRLKYYYAVASFSSVEAANSVYNECDGMEFELSATRFDLRFVPDDMQFDEEDLKDECSTLPDPDKYKPKIFFNKALMQGKAELTWDEDDPERRAAMKRALENPDADDDDLKAYLASSSDDEACPPVFESIVAPASSSSDEEDTVQKYKALLADIKQSDKKEDEDSEGGMTMTFADTSKVDEELKQKELEAMTPWEKYLHKRKEKRKAKRAKKEEQEDDVPDELASDPFFQHSDDEKPRKNVKKKSKLPKATEEGDKDLPLLVMDSDDDKKHFDYKDIVKTSNMSKKKLKKLKKSAAEAEDDFKMDLQDDRFGAMFDNAAFNVDPSHPNFKKTKSMQAIVEEKQKRIKRKPQESRQPPVKKPKTEEEDRIQKLMHSVKSKSNFMHHKRSGKKNT